MYTNTQLSVCWVKVNARYLRSGGNCKHSFHPGGLWTVHIAHLHKAQPLQNTTFTCNIFNLNKSNTVKRKMPPTEYLAKESKAVSCCVKISRNIVKCFYRQVICCEMGGSLSALNKEELCYKLYLQWDRRQLYVTLYKKLPSLQVYFEK